MAVQVASQRLKVLVDGFCADHITQAFALTLKAKSLGNVASSLQTEINSLKDDLKRETLFFPCRRTSQELQHAKDALASLNRILVGLEVALQANVTSKRLQGPIMRESLVYATEWVSLALREMSHCGSLKQQVNIILEEQRKVLCSFDKALAALRGKVGYPSASNMGSFVVTKFPGTHDTESHGTAHCNDDAPHHSVFNHGDSEMMGTMPKAAEDATGEPGEDGSIPLCKSLPSMHHNKKGALISFEEQAATAFFLFHVKKFVVEMGHILESCQECPKTAKKSHIFPFQKLCEKCTSGERAQDERFWQRRCLDVFSFKLDIQQLKSVLRLSLTMAIGGILGFLFNNNRGYWADITVAMGFRALLKKDVFKIASLRTLGISCGSIYGLLVAMGLRALLQGVVSKTASLQTLGLSGGSNYELLVAISTAHLPILKFVALMPWAILTSFLRKSKIFDYGGGVSSFTAAVVILASKPSKDYTDQEFTIIRIVEALLGLASFVAVEILVFPERTRSRVKPEMIAGTRELQKFVTSILEAYSSEQLCDMCRTEELQNKQQKLKRVISRQAELVEEAAEEPQFWFVPFRAKLFSKAVEEQKKLFEMLHVGIEGLNGIKREAAGKIGMDELLQGELKAAMSIVLEKKVVPTLEFLANVLAFNEEEEQPKTPLQALSDERCMEAFERVAVQVMYVVASSEALRGNEVNNTEDCSEKLSNSIFLSLGTLAFTIKGLLRQATELYNVSLEILEAENPMKLVH